MLQHRDSWRVAQVVETGGPGHDGAPTATPPKRRITELMVQTFVEEEWESVSARTSRHRSSHRVRDRFTPAAGDPSRPALRTRGEGLWSARYGLHYGKALAAASSLATALWVLDRLTTNAWPRQSFGAIPGEHGGGTGSDKLVGWKAGPWTAQLYDGTARVSGRFLTASLNTLMWTMMHTTHFALAESGLAARRWVDFADAPVWTLWLHRVNGHLTGALLIFHIYVILLPAVLNGFSVYITGGRFAWPLSERRTEGTSIDAVQRLIGLQADDVWRLVQMSLIFFVLLPWSLRLLRTNYRRGIEVHKWLFVAYWVDIVRRHTHPHNWVLNIPPFAAWLVDRAALARWRHCPRAAAERLILSPDYMVLTWDQPQAPLRTSGPEFLLKLADCPAERRHPLTGFQRHAELGLLVLPPAAIAEPAWTGHVFHVSHGTLYPNAARRAHSATAAKCAAADWRCGVVVRIYHGARSHTRKAAEVPRPALSVCGPFEGSMSADIHRRLAETEQLVVVAGGSGAGYLLDCMQNHAAYGACPALFLFTTADVGLFQWFTWMAQTLQERAAAGGGDVAARAARGFVVAALTAKGVAMIDTGEGEGAASSLLHGEVALGRLQFAELLRPFAPVPCHVYIQGSAALQRALRSACLVNGCRLTCGASYDNSGPHTRPTDPEALYRTLPAGADATKHDLSDGTHSPLSRIASVRALAGASAAQVLRTADAIGLGDVPGHYLACSSVLSAMEAEEERGSGGGGGGGGGGGKRGARAAAAAASADGGTTTTPTRAGLKALHEHRRQRGLNMYFQDVKPKRKAPTRAASLSLRGRGRQSVASYLRSALTSKSDRFRRAGEHAQPASTTGSPVHQPSLGRSALHVPANARSTDV
jgi:hypothetical protein